ncbi:MAG: type II secretion system protein GspJ [Candidatus Dactylopiibacterium carminicum]|nr:type II secretion system minor pseudopilin GspJ [Candidatus Dactylopiibacterium carminicum]PAS98572.1 MAG: type II secretion system protein GspJ [Candidatus Dactylopiibacterium carminicum]
MHRRGFTLIEVLVALAVFAVVTLLAWRGLDVMVGTKARLDGEMRRWRELELVFERLALDLTQIAPRFWVDEQGRTRSAVQASGTTSGAQCQLDLMRFGVDNLPVHARYRLQDGRFTLQILPTSQSQAQSLAEAASALAEAEGKTPDHLLLDDVSRCDLAFLDGNNVWQARWPNSDTLSDATRPRGMRLRLTLDGRGQFERIYYLP